VQNAINSAVTGDRVLVPSGTSTWGSNVTIPDTKGISIIGSNPIITGKLDISQNSSRSTRVSGFTFISTGVGGVTNLSIGGDINSKPFRVDHCTFNSSSGGITFFQPSGNAPGLFDHNNLNAPTNSEMVHNFGLGAGNFGGWTNIILPGDWRFAYFEDNNFINNDPNLLTTNPANFFGNSCIQGYYGARSVLRHNYMFMSQIDMHGGGVGANPGARWWEISDNTFEIVLNGNQDRYMGFRSGSGIVYNNHKIGQSNGGAGNIDMSLQASDDPIYGPGKGQDFGSGPTSEPVYLTGNDSSMHIGSDQLTVNIGYFLSAKPGYTAFRYPYPLDADGLPDPLQVTPDLVILMGEGLS
jgi:hypothetical protein